MRTPIGLTLVNLLFAGVTFAGLFCAFAFTDAQHSHLKRQRYFDPYPIELGLTILGSLGTAFSLLCLIENGYALLLPGILSGGLAFALFLRRAEGWQAVAVEAAFSLGAVTAIWTFVRGATDATTEVGRSLDSIGLGYGSLTRAVVAGLLWIGVPLLTLRLRARHHRRGILRHFELTQNPTYRKLQEEKRQLERQLRDIDDKQLWMEEQRTPSSPATIR